MANWLFYVFFGLAFLSLELGAILQIIGSYRKKPKFITWGRFLMMLTRTFALLSGAVLVANHHTIIYIVETTK